MIQDDTEDNFFQQFGTDRLERYWSVVCCGMGVTDFKDGNNTGDLFFFFFTKVAQLIFRQLQKLSARNIAALKCESRKTKIMVDTMVPPYAV